jgi:hypothetical protein
MGNGLSNGSVGMVGAAIHEMRAFSRPTCDLLVAYMHTYGLDIDVPAEVIMRKLGLAEVGGNGMGPYNGRVNKNELSKGSSLRLVLGKTKGTYRLIMLA